MEYAQVIIEALTFLAISFAVLQLVGDRTQRHREFENLYVQRYWTILDDMSDAFYLHASQAAQETESDKRLIVAYLRLCEDEIDIRRQGFVTDRTWAIWADGICTQLEEEPYKRAFKEIQSDLPSLSRFLVTGSDPLLWSRVKRWWSGLR